MATQQYRPTSLPASSPYRPRPDQLPRPRPDQLPRLHTGFATTAPPRTWENYNIGSYPAPPARPPPPPPQQHPASLLPAVPQPQRRSVPDFHTPRNQPELPASLRIGAPSRYRQSCPGPPRPSRSKYLSSPGTATKTTGQYVPFRPKPNGGKGADDIAALVQAEIDEIERRISHAEATKHRASAPSIVKSVAPIKTTLVTPGDVHTPVATPVLETSPAGSEVATPTGKKRNVYTPVTTPVLQNDSEVVTPTQKQPPPRSDSMYSSAVDEPPESPVLEDKPRPEEYSRTDSGLFGEIRRTLTFEEKYVEDWDEEQELEEYTDEFEEVLKEYVQRSREVGLDVVRIGSVRRSI